MKELEEACFKANVQLNQANEKNSHLDLFVNDLKQQVRALEQEVKQKSALSVNEMHRIRSEFDNEKNKIKVQFEGKFEKLF